MLTGIEYISYGMKPELQIRQGIEDNSKLFFSYFSIKTYVEPPHWNRLHEMVLMMGHKICLYE